MGLLVQLTAVIFILLLVSTHHPTAGIGHDPLLVLDGYEDGGIRLKCFSERLFSEVQVLWTDGRGDNITGTPLTTGTTTANTSSSIILKPGSGNSVSCKIIDKLLKTSTESSVVIAENNKTTTREIDITLDENCKHPSLIIKEKNRVKSSTQEEILPKAVVVATEGFSEKKHYWEVEVGDKSEWELGVGEYSLTGGKGVRNWKPCSVVGVFLDQEECKLSFFDVEEKCLLESLCFEFSGNLYPFFSPGSDGKWLGLEASQMYKSTYKITEYFMGAY
ncbi:PREDICTED: butyrophilin subfamily 3 member A3-like [Pygoscelis adeliae]|uniref:butyrophilin subfamily 3 member A3-like n=1 Tax=Pygoscelis adeliae TaxID=9238 RepID=UPI0004F4F66C|nr:PREDICTED: butyrophilin subfamily 3 member A3-like [Pygoscelis adeliae]